MARAVAGKNEKKGTNNPKFKVTSVGHSNNTRPSSKAQKRCWKKYRGQGR